MNDVVEVLKIRVASYKRLAFGSCEYASYYSSADVHYDEKAIAEITRLRAKVAELEAAQHRIADEALERAAKVADKWATDEQRKFGNGGPAAEIRALKGADDD